MKEIFLMMFINFSGVLLMRKGVDPITAIYFAVLLAGMLGYIYVLILETKKPNVDGNQQKARND
ncbi:hypothetical protein [Mammaliicoccus fleurettii]|uniref:hypothetical protein n=1 Tax=Mammaliicoccus fleurettii TaxID=150056 RepID=UPI002DBB7AD5|nr:hypothetical protein [Mammaliicoccus fleurettii]MEB8067691.1 hypothetical protein [Mammaliicoccus fleurettii]